MRSTSGVRVDRLHDDTLGAARAPHVPARRQALRLRRLAAGATFALVAPTCLLAGAGRAAVRGTGLTDPANAVERFFEASTTTGLRCSGAALTVADRVDRVAGAGFTLDV